LIERSLRMGQFLIFFDNLDFLFYQSVNFTARLYFVYTFYNLTNLSYEKFERIYIYRFPFEYAKSDGIVGITLSP
jgi:hypothetical protein